MVCIITALLRFACQRISQTYVNVCVYVSIVTWKKRHNILIAYLKFQHYRTIFLTRDLETSDVSFYCNLFLNIMNKFSLLDPVYAFWSTLELGSSKCFGWRYFFLAMKHIFDLTNFNRWIPQGPTETRCKPSISLYQWTILRSWSTFSRNSPNAWLYTNTINQYAACLDEGLFPCTDFSKIGRINSKLDVFNLHNKACFVISIPLLCLSYETISSSSSSS